MRPWAPPNPAWMKHRWPKMWRASLEGPAMAGGLGSTVGGDESSRGLGIVVGLRSSDSLGFPWEVVEQLLLVNLESFVESS